MAEEFMRLSSFVSGKISLPALILKDEASRPSSLNTNNLNFSNLVELRRSHQTRYAADGVRTRDIAEADGPEESIRRRLMRELNGLLRQEQSRAPGTGQDRKLRWLEPAQESAGSIPGSQPIPAPTGNSANAAVVAQSRVKKVSSSLRTFSLNTNDRSGTRISTKKARSCKSSTPQTFGNWPSFFPLPYNYR